jgi:anti-anti-sigma factor
VTRKRRCPLNFEKFTIQEIKGVREGEQLLKLAGALTMTTLSGFRDTVQRTTAPLLILDLTDVPYVDSAAVGLLVNAHVSCVSRGRRLVLVGIVERVRTLLAATRVDRVLTVFPTLQEAEVAATSWGATSQTSQEHKSAGAGEGHS